MNPSNTNAATFKRNGPPAVLGSQRSRTRRDAQIESTLLPQSEALRAEDGWQSAAQSSSLTELLLLKDGRILAHNLTPEVAELLRELNPADEQIQPRTPPATPEAPRVTSSAHELPN